MPQDEAPESPATRAGLPPLAWIPAVIVVVVALLALFT